MLEASPRTCLLFLKGAVPGVDRELQEVLLDPVPLCWLNRSSAGQIQARLQQRAHGVSASSIGQRGHAFLPEPAQKLLCHKCPFTSRGICVSCRERGTWSSPIQQVLSSSDRLLTLSRKNNQKHLSLAQQTQSPPSSPPTPQPGQPRWLPKQQIGFCPFQLNLSCGFPGLQAQTLRAPGGLASAQLILQPHGAAAPQAWSLCIRRSHCLLCPSLHSPAASPLLVLKTPSNIQHEAAPSGRLLAPRLCSRLLAPSLSPRRGGLWRFLPRCPRGEGRHLVQRCPKKFLQ
ncbi:uncharacterized protein LOC111742270 [Pteropus vampyrus]|uniref:Uncharacterized protein LOC111742270 n=1 Tax=Pteropus vampyrus TaxID=132908 RepID=A0A6P6CMK6_PTEVA|nr:uncharacterized protein LOC111742270 [Pteropus vampyrus]